MKIVIDTNILLVSFSRESELRPIFEGFLNEEFTICVTTDILIEYEDIIGRHLGANIATNVLRLIENAPNVEWITKYFGGASNVMLATFSSRFFCHRRRGTATSCFAVLTRPHDVAVRLRR